MTLPVDGRQKRLPRQSGLAQLALFTTIVTHRVSIQPFHSRGDPQFLSRVRPILCFDSLGTWLLIPAAGLSGPSPRRHNLGSCPRPSQFSQFTNGETPATHGSTQHAGVTLDFFRVSHVVGLRPCAACRSPLLLFCQGGGKPGPPSSHLVCGRGNGCY